MKKYLFRDKRNKTNTTIVERTVVYSGLILSDYNSVDSSPYMLYELDEDGNIIVPDSVIQSICEVILLGTCQTVEEVFEYFGIDYDELSHKQLCILDNITFCCDGCGWWCEGIADRDGNCSDCTEVDEEEDY